MAGGKEFDVFYIRFLNGQDKQLDVFLGYEQERKRTIDGEIEILVKVVQTKNDSVYDLFKQAALHDKSIEMWEVNLSKQENLKFETKYFQGNVNEKPVNGNVRITVHKLPQIGYSELPDDSIDFIQRNKALF